MNYRKKKINLIIDYAIVYLLVAMSGIPFFYKSDLALLVPSAFLSFAVYALRRRQIDRHSFIYFAAMFIVLYAQMIKFDFFPVKVYLGIFLRIFFAYFVIRAVGSRFIKIFINVIVASTIISYFFYFPSYLPGIERTFISISPYFDTPFRNHNAAYMYWPGLILYNINSKGGSPPLLRNSGPFWEPGAFAGYLVVALAFNIIIYKTFFNKKGKHLLFGLLTTFSSTGYVALFAILIFYIMVKAEFVYKMILIPILIAVSIVAFTSIDFLGEKISENADISGNTHNTRFTSAMLDLNDTYENPLLGLGRSGETRFKGSLYAHENHRNNGTSGFLATYGIPFFILYFFFIYLGISKLCKIYNMKSIFALYFVILLLLIGFSEVYFFYPFFYGLPLLYPILRDWREFEDSDMYEAYKPSLEPQL